MTDFDSPWKEALETYFQAFLQLFFPLLHAAIDWSRGYEFLDKELQKIMPKAARGRRYVDKLVKVWRRDGREAWVLIHVEVQAQREHGFPQRMYDYNTRLAARYNRTVVSLAVLADDDPAWRPDHYAAEMWGWSVRMTWPAVKLLDYAERVAELEQSKNPFAHVVLAHLKALETRHDPAARETWKFRLVRGLYERGFRKEEIQQLFRVIDWLMVLPTALEEQFEQQLGEFQEERRMTFVDFFERRILRRLIESALRAKFGEEGLVLLPLVAGEREGEKYIALNEAIINAGTLEEARQAYEKATAPRRRRKKGEGKSGSSNA